MLFRSKESMPGMMDTVLNIGLNDVTVASMIKLTNNPRFVYDIYRRLLHMFSSVVLEIADEHFENLLLQYEAEKGYKVDTEMTAEEVHHSLDVLKSRLRELAFLNPGLAISVEDERTGEKKEYHFDGGIRAFVEYLDRGKTALFTPPVILSGERDGIAIDVGFQYNDSYLESGE